jgi:hypothetical protein
MRVRGIWLCPRMSRIFINIHIGKFSPHNLHCEICCMLYIYVQYSLRILKDHAGKQRFFYRLKKQIFSKRTAIHPITQMEIGIQGSR